MGGKKREKEMSKFFVVESAFKNIKISTGVNDAETLVNKFLNKESAYGDLLDDIQIIKHKSVFYDNCSDIGKAILLFHILQCYYKVKMGLSV